MLDRARDFLARRNLDESRLDAELLVAHVLGLDRLHLFLQLDRPVTEPEIDRARDLLVRRAAHEPVAYLTGQREFYGRPFRVDARVLIPRPETELLVDLARERAKSMGPSPRVADVGTGSGCIAITVALEVPESRVVAVDRSAAALEVARANAAALGAEVRFVRADGTEALGHGLALVLCNPPYVTPEAAASLAPEVREHEPPEALLAPPGDPDHWLRRLLEAAPSLLAEGGALLVELGHDQSERAHALAGEFGFAPVVHDDLAGIGRVLEVRRAAGRRR